MITCLGERSGEHIRQVAAHVIARRPVRRTRPHGEGSTRLTLAVPSIVVRVRMTI